MARKGVSSLKAHTVIFNNINLHIILQVVLLYIGFFLTTHKVIEALGCNRCLVAIDKARLREWK